MKPILDRWNRSVGFTMMEVIIVLILIAIVSAITAFRLSHSNNYNLPAQREVIKSHLRLAQARAMSYGSPWGIKFETTKTYYMFQGIGSNTPVLIPGEKQEIVDLSAKKSDLVVTSAPQVVTFDSFGSPGTANITVTTNGGDIFITKNTGFIP